MGSAIESVRKLLEEHLVDISKITHVENDGAYWLVFNDKTMTGFELTMAGENIYTIDVWSTTEFYIDLHLRIAKKIK